MCKPFINGAYLLNTLKYSGNILMMLAYANSKYVLNKVRRLHEIYYKHIHGSLL